MLRSKGRTDIIVLGIVCIVFLTSTIALFIMKELEHKRCVIAELRLEETEKANDALKSDLEELIKIKSSIEAKLDELVRKNEILDSEFKAIASEKETLTEELNKKTLLFSSIKEDVDSERKARLVLVEKLSMAEEDYQAIKDELDIVRKAKEALETRLSKLKNDAKGRIKLEKIVVTSNSEEKLEYTPRPAPVIIQPEHTSTNYSSQNQNNNFMTGQLMVVNRIFGFIVVNLGVTSGLELDTKLKLYDNNIYLGDAQVEKLYNNMSALTILTLNMINRLQEGDVIRIKSAN